MLVDDGLGEMGEAAFLALEAAGADFADDLGEDRVGFDQVRGGGGPGVGVGSGRGGTRPSRVRSRRFSALEGPVPPGPWP